MNDQKTEEASLEHLLRIAEHLHGKLSNVLTVLEIVIDVPELVVLAVLHALKVIDSILQILSVS